MTASLRHLFNNAVYFIQARRSTVRGLSLLYTGNTIASLTGLLSVIVLANLLSPNDYGNYKYVYSVVGILTAFSLTNGLRTLVIQSAVRGYDGIVKNLFSKNLILNLPMFLVGIGVGVYYLLNENILLALGISIATTATILGNNGIIASAYLNGKKNYKKLLIAQSLISISNTFAITIAALLFQTYVSVIVSLSIISSLISIGLYFYIRTRLLHNDKTNDELHIYGKHLNILGVMSTIMQHIDSVLIFKFLGSYNLALYALATPFVDRISGFIKASYMFALPKITEMGPEKTHKVLYKRCLLAFLLGWVVFFIYIAASPFLFKFLFPQYLASLKLSWIFALNIPLFSLSILPQAFIDSLLEIQNKYILNISTFLVRITTLLLFIYPFGVLGVICSELVTRVSGLFVIFYLIQKHKKTALKKA